MADILREHPDLIYTIVSNGGNLSYGSIISVSAGLDDSYQISVILTHEDGFWRFSARSGRNGDVVHRHETATLSESRQKPPAGFLMGQDHRDLV